MHYRGTVWIAALCVALIGSMASAAGAQAERPYLGEIGGVSDPYGMATDAQDNLYVSDRGSGTVKKLDPAGNLVLEIDGEGHFQAGGAYLRSVAVDWASGDVYVAEGDEELFEDPVDPLIHVFDSSGAYLTTWNGEATPDGDWGLAQVDLAIDNQGYESNSSAQSFYVSQQYTGGLAKNGVASLINRVDALQMPTVFEASNDPVKRYLSKSQILGRPVGFQGEIKLFSSGGIDGLSVDSAGNIYAADAEAQKVDQFAPSGAHLKSFEGDFGAVSAIAIDPTTGALLVADPGKGVVHEFDASGLFAGDITGTPTGPGGQLVPFGSVAGVAVDSDGTLHVADPANQTIHSFGPLELPAGPEVLASWSSGVHADSATVAARIDPRGGVVGYRFQYGPTTAYGSETPEAHVGLGGPHEVNALLGGLAPGTTYHYRLIAHTVGGATEGPDRTFTTFPFSPSLKDTCPNALARQQTGAALLFDCRAYELVSAADADGYDVESDLISGQEPFGGYPEAHGKALYAIHDGGIEGVGHPTNHGPDPYLATRGASGWSTQYVGIPADNPFATAPFASTLAEASADLSAFAFAGPEICSPCFADGSSGIPLRTKDGSLIQGMAGSIPSADPEPAGKVQRRFSADGTHFLFGSSTKLTEDANEGGDTTIYERDLSTGVTQVVSKTPSGETMSGPGIDALDVSADGSRVLIGQEVAKDPEGNSLYRLFMHIGDSEQTVELTPGAEDGVLYAGMSEDGSAVYFTATDALSTDSDQDTDEGADLYRADVSSTGAVLTRVSTGSGGAGDVDDCDPAANSAREHWNTTGPEANCGVLAIAGGGGVAGKSGDAYFLSPEQLAGPSSGVKDAPNLYLARPGQEPRFIATLESALNGPQPPATYHPFESSFGSFAAPTGIATDAAGRLYVLDLATNSVERFDAEGNPAPFAFDPGSAEAPGNALTGADTPAGHFSQLESLGLAAQIAVDGAGNLYVPDLIDSVVDKFDSEGNYLSQLPVPFATGVAVDPANGDVYATSFFGTVEVFDSAANPLRSFPVLGSASAAALDSSGTLYVANGTEAAAYDTAGNFIRQLDANPSFGLAVDPSNEDVYVSEGDRIARFDAAGKRLRSEGVGVLTEAVGVALGADGRLYAANAGKEEVAIFGAPALAPSPLIDNPAVVDALSDAYQRRSADFQLTPSGEFAAFPTTLALTGYDNDTHTELFRYAASEDQLACVSCPASGERPSADASLATGGNSLSDDGRVFYTTANPLARQDLNGQKDAYEWRAGEIGLISSGSSPYGSGLLSVTRDGTDAFFFTREKLAKDDENGSAIRLYDARERGGNFIVPTPKPCAASDECHGPSSPQPAPADVKSVAGTAAKAPPARCAKGKVRRRGRCLRRRGKAHHKRAAHKGQGKGKANRDGRAGK